MRLCELEGCDRKHYAKGKCQRHYQQDYLKRPEVQAHKQAYFKDYHQSPRYKERKRRYSQRPEVKARDKARNKAYSQRPEVRERNNLAARERYHRKRAERLTAQDAERRYFPHDDPDWPCQLICLGCDGPDDGHYPNCDVIPEER